MESNGQGTHRPKHEKSPLFAGSFDSNWRRRRDSRGRFAPAYPSLASSVGRIPRNVSLARSYPSGRNSTSTVRIPVGSLDMKRARYSQARSILTGGGGGIRTLVTRITGKTVFETAAFNHSATPPRWGVRLKASYAKRAEARYFFLAERWGFEPQIPFWGIHDFQSCSFGQLGHLSALPIAAAKYYTDTTALQQEEISNS